MEWLKFLGMHFVHKGFKVLFMEYLYNRISGLLGAIAIVISILAVLYSTTYHKKTDQISSIVHTIYSNQNSSESEADSLKNELVRVQFEKETYLSQLSILSDWIILYFSILFAAFGLIGFRYFSNEFKSAKSGFDSEIIRVETDYNNKINNIKTEIETNTKTEVDNFKSEIEKFKKEITNQNEELETLNYHSNLAIGNICALLAESSVNNLYIHLNYIIQYALHYVKAWKFEQDELILKISRDYLKKVASTLSDLEDIEQFKKQKENAIFDPQLIFEALKEISYVDIDMSLLCSKILTKYNQIIPGIFIKDELVKQDS